MLAKLLQLKLCKQMQTVGIQKKIFYGSKKKNYMTGDHRLLFLRDTSTICSGNVEASVKVLKMSFADNLFLMLSFENFQIFSRCLPLVGQGACKHFCSLWILFPSFLKGSFMREEFFILMVFNTSHYPFMGHSFGIISKNSFSCFIIS